ncbi:hypothetical protein [Aquimarina litoralis]|uniref:hypothetical protein n=1 Tax=Aquimarina litoralis TaxID=584605 RepID=UPI001C5A2B7E|nr:hypothetical protein [Aquimarina litoralis]MBW1297779.1 hypothetical protein [Aquimarina litoralis]
MVDGIKILCVGTDYRDWEKNELLQFQIKVDDKTRLSKTGRKFAKHQGLYFSIIPSTKSNTKHCIVRGSLHRYYNQGRDNASDFGFMELQEVINDLQNVFHIDLRQAKIQTLEYGVNIFTNSPARNIIRGIRAYGNSAFERLKTDAIYNGRQLKRQLFKYKVYDKGIQQSKSLDNLLRVEVAFDSIKEIGKYGVEVLEDLRGLNKVCSLKERLLAIWEDMIFYDKGMQYRRMTRWQREKMLYYLDANNWEKFTPMQRLRAKKHFRELYNEFCTSTTQKDILLSIRRKLESLTTLKSDVLRNYYSKNGLEKQLYITDIDKQVKHHINDIPEKSKNRNMKSVKKKNKKCLVCVTNISHKRAGTIYCSNKCKDSYHSKKRTKLRREKKEAEKKNLNKLKKLIPKQHFFYIISCKGKGLSYTNRLLRLDANTSSNIISTINTVEVRRQERGEKVMRFTSYRARELIKIVIQKQKPVGKSKKVL